jgi:ABC-type histidine transport system ATPase subunit
MILEVESLDLFYGDAQALDGISIAAEEGELVAIVGAAFASGARTSPACQLTAPAIWASARSRKGGRCFLRSP